MLAAGTIACWRTELLGITHYNVISSLLLVLYHHTRELSLP